jgi:hypothetical protein
MFIVVVRDQVVWVRAHFVASVTDDLAECGACKQAARNHMILQKVMSTCSCRTQDFATPCDRGARRPFSQAGSQAPVLPALMPPPTFDAVGKRARVTIEPQASRGEPIIFPSTKVP